MSLSVDASLSALWSLSTRQSVSANNVANTESEEFKKSRTVLEENQNGGVSAKVQQVNTPGTMVMQEDGTMKELSNVDLVQEMTDMAVTKNSYKANIKAIQTADEMDKTTLDLIG